MITWLSRGVTNIWLRLGTSIFIFGWLIWIAWRENRNYRAITRMVTDQFHQLQADHARAEVAMRLLAEQLLRNSLELTKNPGAVKQTAKALKDLPDPKP